MRQDEILKKAQFKEQNGVKILRIKGKPYEMGYQHGYLLAGRIALMVNRTLLATAAYVAKQTGSDIKKAQEMLWTGQKKAEPFLPGEFKEEMRGIADGVNAAGVKVALEQILLGIPTMTNGVSIAIPITGSVTAGEIRSLRA